MNVNNDGFDREFRNSRNDEFVEQVDVEKNKYLKKETRNINVDDKQPNSKKHSSLTQQFYNLALDEETTPSSTEKKYLFKRKRTCKKENI